MTCQLLISGYMGVQMLTFFYFVHMDYRNVLVLKLRCYFYKERFNIAGGCLYR